MTCKVPCLIFPPCNLAYDQATSNQLLLYILLVRAFSSFAPIVKTRVTPVHTFPDRQERTGAYGNKCHFGVFQVLGRQPGSEILCAVSILFSI